MLNRFPSIESRIPNRSGLALVAMLLAITGDGCTAARYYGAVPLPGGSFSDRERDSLVAQVEAKLPQSALSKITVVVPSRGLKISFGDSAPLQPPLPLAEVPTPALGALLAVLGKSTRGAELDLLIPISEKLRVPVTVYHERDGSLQIHQGEPRPALAAQTLPSIPTPADLKARYGIAPSDFGDTVWTAEYYVALDKALSLLSQDELALLSRVPIVRQRVPPDIFVDPKYHEHVMALYTQLRGVARIELYDQLFADDDELFTGTPESPLSRSVWAILHEVGHVIADATRATVARDLRSSAHSYLDRVDELAEQKPGPTPDTFYVSKAEAAELDEKLYNFEAAIEWAEQMGKRGPVLPAYRRARSESTGPTSYGSTSLNESFAESFAMFHSDPAALQRIDPDAYAWFQRAGHIHALAD